MKSSAILAIAFSAVAFAAPQHGQGGQTGRTVSEVQEQCNGQNLNQVSCCNSGGSSGGLINIPILSDLIDLQCSQINIPINIGAGSINSNPIQQHCNSQIACCPAGTKVSLPFLPSVRLQLLTCYAGLLHRLRHHLRTSRSGVITLSMAVMFEAV